MLKEAWDEYKSYAKPRKPGHRDYDEGEDLTFASFNPKFLADSQDPDYSFISDEDAMMTQELKKKDEFRFMTKAERLDFLEREQFAQTGPIGGPHPPEPPTTRLSRCAASLFSLYVCVHVDIYISIYIYLCVCMCSCI